MTGTDDTAAEPGAADSPPRPSEAVPARDVRTVVPIVAAFAVVAMILIAIVVGGVLAPAEENVTEADKVAMAVRDFVDARNSNDPNRLRTAVCPAFNEARAPLPAVRAELVRVEHAKVDSGRGTADVTIKSGGTERTSLDAHPDRWALAGVHVMQALFSRAGHECQRLSPG